MFIGLGLQKHVLNATTKAIIADFLHAVLAKSEGNAFFPKQILLHSC